MQAGDPAQQKLMMYFMPGMFTVFMLFLPAGLGIYMFTNSLLGIGQQQIVERHVRHSLAARKAQASEPPAAGKAPTGKKAK
jgi:YidC/Oxa1 family membrane protein insertase